MKENPAKKAIVAVCAGQGKGKTTASPGHSLASHWTWIKGYIYPVS